MQEDEEEEEEKGSTMVMRSAADDGLERRSLRSTLLPALLKKEDGCNTDPHMCDAKKHHECCRGRCRNVHSNALHCGGCGRSCRQGRSCCAASCVDLNKDRANCGGCGNACLDCHNGLCGYAD
ncbi:hypothetical protein L7F22_000221 [Adiantum nelumboides]|nr:hypothetical protein [Adiantum nelumboides]